MRNLKKILALVLALVMSLSLVTIASGADFNDADEITLTEAVDVMTAIGVLEGHNTGDFAPQGTLTREPAGPPLTSSTAPPWASSPATATAPSTPAGT